MAVGVFDGVHAGHRLLIDKVVQVAAETATRASIMTFAPHPLRIVRPERAPRLLTPIDERRELILQAGAQEVIVREFDENLRKLTSAEFLALLRREYSVEHLVVGFNHRFGSDRECSHDDYVRVARELGMTVSRADEVVMPELTLPVSSSSVREYLDKGLVIEAAEMLMRPYSLTGEVVAGKGLGKTIGFPTANVSPLCTEQLVPMGGVYACRAEINGESRKAVVNIGTCPTVGSSQTATIEAHIIGLDRDLYGEKITLHFLRRLRDERRFPTLDALRAQITLDIELGRDATWTSVPILVRS